MRAGWIGAALLVVSGLVNAASHAQPAGPGAAATDAVTSPTRPPAEVAPPLPPPSERRMQGAAAEPGRPSGSPDETRELLEAARATARATREAVEYGRVVPDLLTQILTKLDKLEDKLDKVENAVKASGRRSR